MVYGCVFSVVVEVGVFFEAGQGRQSRMQCRRGGTGYQHACPSQPMKVLRISASVLPLWVGRMPRDRINDEPELQINAMSGAMMKVRSGRLGVRL